MQSSKSNSSPVMARNAVGGAARRVLAARSLDRKRIGVRSRVGRMLPAPDSAIANTTVGAVAKATGNIAVTAVSRVAEEGNALSNGVIPANGPGEGRNERRTPCRSRNRYR